MLGWFLLLGITATTIMIVTWLLICRSTASGLFGGGKARIIVGLKLVLGHGVGMRRS